MAAESGPHAAVEPEPSLNPCDSTHLQAEPTVHAGRQRTIAEASRQRAEELPV